MSDWGIKVSNAGTGVASTDIRDQIMNSQYSMFKYHSDGTVAVTFNAGDTVAYGTVSHGLGYVPAFMSYVNYPSDSYQRLVPSIPYGVSFNHYANAYAGTSNVVVSFNLTTPYNQTRISGQRLWNDWSGSNLSWRVGKRDGDRADSAVRFTNVNFSGTESFSSVILEPYVSDIGNTGDVKMTTYGVNEDNTGDFDSSPMGRSRTTAYKSQTQTTSSTPFTFNIDVKEIFEEITSRANWKSGNAMAFLNFDNITDDGKYMFHDGASDFSLIVTKTGTLTVTFRVIIFKDKIV
jgi:hypothetical protein